MHRRADRGLPVADMLALAGRMPHRDRSSAHARCPHSTYPGVTVCRSLALTSSLCSLWGARAPRWLLSRGGVLGRFLSRPVCGRFLPPDVGKRFGVRAHERRPPSFAGQRSVQYEPSAILAGQNHVPFAFVLSLIAPCHLHAGGCGVVLEGCTSVGVSTGKRRSTASSRCSSRVSSVSRKVS